MENRDSFGNRFGVLVALAGSAVGLGNLWRFPYLVGNNGGAIFIIFYLFFVFLICLPLMFSEFVIGRRSQANVFGAFKKLSPNKSPFWSKIGIISVFCSLTILSFYSVVGGWTIDYLIRSLCFQLTPESNFNTMFLESSQSTLRPLLYTFIFLFFTALIVITGVKKGIEKYSKILMPILFIMVIFIAIRSLTLPSANKGIEFLFNPDFSKLTTSTILEALGQAFFSLSIGCGTIITYASYVKANENIIKVSTYTALADIIFAMLAGLAIMPAVFAFGASPTEGPGLVFVIIPQIFAQVPLGALLAIVFFFILLFAALTSSISLLEVVVAFILEEFHIKRKSAVSIAFSLTLILAILCSLSLGILKGWPFEGFTFFDFLDKLSANILLPLGGLLFMLFVGWKMKKDDYFDELTNKHLLPINKFLLIVIHSIVKYIVPIIIVVIMIFGILK